MEIEQFTSQLPGGVTVTSTFETDVGFGVDFDILSASRSVPSVVTFTDGVTDEFVIRLPRLPKQVWSEDGVERAVRQTVSTVGLSSSKYTITPGLRREPRRSNLAPDDYWYPHLEVDAGLAPPEAGKLVGRLADRL